MEALIIRLAIVVLALISSAIYGARRQWENVITRMMIAGVFMCILIGIPLENATVNLLIRWLFIITLFVEVLSWVVRTLSEDNKNGRR